MFYNVQPVRIISLWTTRMYNFIRERKRTQELGLT